MESNNMDIAVMNSVPEIIDKLELYFKDLYERELVFKIDRSEVGFIQDGIEHLVKGINRLVAYQARTNVKSATATFKEQQGNIKLVDQSAADEETGYKTDILKIGSFYEVTKNSYPDEFDFVFILADFESQEMTKSCLPYRNESEVRIHDVMRTMLGSADAVPQNIKMFETSGLVYGPTEKDKRELKFERYVEMRDCVSRLLFVYKCNEEANGRNIFVDIATGFRITENTREMMDTRCPLPEFVNEHFNNNSVLVVGGVVHFTEQELLFMKTILSKHHLKVYRILKYLINGHGDYDEVRKLLDVSMWPTLISSYTIKLLMIYHHYECTCNGDITLTACITNILDQLQNISTGTCLWNLSDVPNHPQIVKDPHRTKLLQNLRESLIDIRESTLPYAYGKYRLIPIATTYLLKEDLSGGQNCLGCRHVVVTVCVVIVLLSLLIFACVTAVSKS